MASVPRGGGDTRGNPRKAETNKFSTGKHQNKSKIAKHVARNSVHTAAVAATNGGCDSYPPSHKLSRIDALVMSKDSSGRNLLPEPVNANDVPGYTRFENRVRISLNPSSRSGIKELTRKLKGELDQVRSLVKKFEAQEVQISGYFGGSGRSQSQFSANNLVEKVGSTLKVSSEVGSAEVPDSRLVRSASVAENFGEFAEKEMRTHNTNKYCPNSELIPGKKFAPSDCDLNEGKIGLVFKSCRNLLEKLMKHKHGWVFNVPVDAKSLGLHDYHKIITKPMDLGTVKTRLNKNWYKSPREFAEDVRLTFNNAITYNPKGEDVHVMAEQLSKMFEEKWTVIEAKQKVGKGFQKDDNSVLPTLTSRKSPAPATPPVDLKTINRSESMTKPQPANKATLGRSDSIKKPPNPKQKSTNFAQPDRLPVSKKPKAKNHDNRDMTYEDKQRLSIDLQNLPSEKLNNVVKIIKKRHQGLFQNDDEIELDIGSVDSETLWELDRFVADYKKSLIKNKRKAEVNLQSGEKSRHSTTETDIALNTAGEPVGGDADSESDSSSTCGLDANLSPSA